MFNFQGLILVCPFFYNNDDSKQLKEVAKSGFTEKLTSPASRVVCDACLLRILFVLLYRPLQFTETMPIIIEILTPHTQLFM